MWSVCLSPGQFLAVCRIGCRMCANGSIFSSRVEGSMSRVEGESSMSRVRNYSPKNKKNGNKE